ncbi:DUF2157 domain-containing protein [Solimonas soli]|uniref:DUF2157 domain-containing protein n=1 Tax=Solimonas soli TaxID=413479 RepID=UPI0004833AB4|nr:DUF2157 domain-containing protein [Solimonas soli]
MAKNAAWLLAELPELERAGVVDAATAARLRAHYADAPERGAALGVSAVLGALLVGLGVILLVAHNWDAWSRGLRLLVTALPLAAGQGACWFALRRRADSRVWREGAAVFSALAFAAALALVAQIFQFGGDLDRYLLSCALVALPLVYALDASLLAVLVGGAWLGWVAAQAAGAREPLLVLLAYATLLPHAVSVHRREPAGLRSVMLVGWLVPLLFAALTLAMPLARQLAALWLGSCALLLILLDDVSGAGGAFVRRPLRAYGELGWALVALGATFPEFWSSRGWFGNGERAALAQIGAVQWLVLAVAAALVLRALLRRRWLPAALALPVAGLVLAEGLPLAPLPLAVFFNAYVLAIGVALIAGGLRERALRVISSGLTLLAVLVLLRFFGSEWPFVMRGVAFVGVGLAFLGAHAWLRRRLRP